jgi:hypothetical protein
MPRLGLTVLALSVTLMPAVYAADAPIGPAGDHHARHFRHSSAAPLAADERSLADAREHRQTQAMNLIGAAGYNDFADMTAVGKDFRATAMKDGQRVSVLVDPDNGRVTAEQ